VKTGRVSKSRIDRQPRTPFVKPRARRFAIAIVNGREINASDFSSACAAPKLSSCFLPLAAQMIENQQ